MDNVSRDELISQNRTYKELKSSRRKMMLLCLAGSLIPLFIYLTGTILLPGIFAESLAGGRLTVGIVLSIGIFTCSWLFKGYYTYVANTKLDRLQRQVLAEVAA